MRGKLRNNPVRAAGGLTALITAFLVELAAWGLTAVPAGVPDDLMGAAEPLTFAVAVLIGERIGQAVQNRWTMPTLPKPKDDHV